MVWASGWVSGTKYRSSARAAGALLSHLSSRPLVLFYFVLFCSKSQPLRSAVAICELFRHNNFSYLTSLISVCDITYSFYCSHINLMSASLLSPSWLMFVCLFVCFFFCITLVGKKSSLALLPQVWGSLLSVKDVNGWGGEPRDKHPRSNEPGVCLYKCSQNKQTKAHLLSVFVIN